MPEVSPTLNKTKLLLSILGWGLTIFGLGFFLLSLEDGWVMTCGGFDPENCLPVLGNLWILVKPTGLSFFILCAGLMIVLREKHFRIPALGLLVLGTIYFFQMLAALPKFCP